MDAKYITEFLKSAISDCLDKSVDVTEHTVIFGKDGLLSSLLLVGLLVKVEDFCLERGIPFDWTTDAAASDKRGRYRTVGSLTEYIAELAAKREQ